MKLIKKYIKNKKGSMIVEYMLLMVVGLIIMGAFNSFLSVGEDVVDKSINKVKNMGNTDESNLGTFKIIN